MLGPSAVASNSHYSERDNSGMEDLEDEQSPVAEKQRSAIQGEDANLTELAASKVVNEQETGDDLEDEESQAEEDENQGDEALAEIAAPEPLSHESSDHETSMPSGDEEKYQPVVPATKQRLLFWKEAVTVSWLIFLSLLGTLARLGVEALATYPYAAIPSPVLWANMGGSLFLGFLLEDRRLFRYLVDQKILVDDEDKNQSHIDKSKKILPLYIGLATGFCGSFTSFSTFITDSFLALSNRLPPADPMSPYHTIQTMQSRNGGYSFLEVVAIIIIHPAVSISALKTGAHIAVGMERFTPSMPARFIHRFLDPLAVILGMGCWIGAILLSIWPPVSDWRRRAFMALVFAPPGCLLRYYLSRTFNACVPTFPLGTFAINIFGTCIEGMCYDLQHSKGVIGNVMSGRVNSCAVLEGVMQGFCGCATTVSTWVVELNGLRRHHAWIYGLASVSVALGSQVAIVGSVAWSAGFDQSCGVRI